MEKIYLPFPSRLFGNDVFQKRNSGQRNKNKRRTLLKFHSSQRGPRKDGEFFILIPTTLKPDSLTFLTEGGS